MFLSVPVRALFWKKLQSYDTDIKQKRLDKNFVIGTCYYYFFVSMEKLCADGEESGTE